LIKSIVNSLLHPFCPNQTSPFSKLLTAIGKDKIPSRAGCGIGSYIFVNERGVEFEAVDEGPAVSLLDTLGIQGKPGPLDGFQVPTGRPKSSFFPLRDLGYGQPVGTSLKGLDDAPLPG
jgi:hypothetical protein